MEPPPNTSLTGTTEVIFNKHEFPGKTAKFVTVNKITAIINTLSNLIATKKMKKAILLSAFILLCTVCHAQEKQTKYQGEIQAGYAFGTGDSKIDHAGVSMINGWRFNRYLSAGLGIGLDYYFKNGYSFVSLPVFANVKGYLPVSDKASLFASLDCGYSVSLKDESEGCEYIKMKGFLITPAIGASISVAERKSVNLSICYNSQKYEYGIAGYRFTDKANSIGFKIGYSF